MARVLVATQPWGVLWEKDPNTRALSIPVSGQAATITTTVYADATGAATVSFVTNANGELPGYVEEGQHTLTVDGVARTVQAVSGTLRAAVTALEAGSDDIVDVGGTTAAAITTAWDAVMAQNGGTMRFPVLASGAYVVDANLTLTATKPVTIDMQDQTLRVANTISFIVQGAVQTAPTLSAAVVRGDKTITLTSATGVQRGDVMQLYEAVAMDSSHNTNRRGTFLVRSVSDNVVTLTSASKMPFSTAATISLWRPPSRFTWKNGTLEQTGSPTFAQTFVNVQGMVRPQFDRLTIMRDVAYVAAGAQNGFGIQTAGTVAAAFTNIKAYGMAYPISDAGSLNTSVDGMSAENCRHCVVPSNWAVGTSVRDLKTVDVWSSIDCHPAFDVTYDGVVALRDTELPNHRGVGGGLSNIRVYTDADNASQGPQFHSSILTDLTWYDEATLTLKDVQIDAPARTTAHCVGANYGRIVLDNVTARLVGTAGTAPSFLSTVGSIVTINCRNPDGTAWPRLGFRKATRVRANPILPAYLETGVYHIDPFKRLVDSEGDVLRCHGPVLLGNATDPQAISVRVHDNAFPSSDAGTFITAKVKLTAMVRHSNAGLFDVLTKEFHAFHKITATSSITLPLVSAYSEALTGQSNESLALTISNPTQAGITELGVTYPDTYFQFDVAISSGRTSPVYGLTYELELVRN